jgi:pimeloyl-ACP methyl ester carboxylesterase
MQYVVLGDGPVPVVVIPAADDGLRMAGEAAPQLARSYRRRARTHRLLVLSRRQPIPEDYTWEQHTDDYIWALEQLGWGPTILECHSAGGPIGQWMAIKRPDLVRGLILSDTMHYPSEHTRAVVTHWRYLAREEKWAELQWSCVEYSFRPQTVARYRPRKSFLRMLPRPRHPERVVRIYDELLALDNRAVVPRIACPTLVIGGEEDNVVPADVHRAMAALIPNSRLVLYPGYGHGNSQENPDYEAQVTRFVYETWEATAQQGRGPTRDTSAHDSPGKARSLLNSASLAPEATSTPASTPARAGG